MTGYAVDTNRMGPIGLINLRARLPVAKAAADAVGIDIPEQPFRVAEHKGTRVVRLSPDQWWLRTTATDEAALFDRLTAARRGAFAAVTVLSDHFQGFSIQGNDADAILMQATALDLRLLASGEVTRTKFARTGATIYVLDPHEHYEVFVESSYADYLAAWLLRAGGHG